MLEKTVMIVSDRSEVADVWSHACAQRGISAKSAGLDSKSPDLFADGRYSLAVVDVNNGEELIHEICREIRLVFDNPILVFTYEEDERYHLGLYEQGVDESVTKPIGTMLLVAKVTAWLARSSGDRTESGSIDFSGFHLTGSTRTVVTPDGQIVKLSKLEYRLLLALLTSRGTMVPTETLLGRVWRGRMACTSSHLKRLVYRLRQKVEVTPNDPKYVETVGNVGYRIPYTN